MTERRAVEVTAKHIRDGARGRSRCPIGLALRKVFQTDDVTVGHFVVDVKGLTYSLPPEAVRFIYAFDARDVVHPFIFELEMP